MGDLLMSPFIKLGLVGIGVTIAVSLANHTDNLPTCNIRFEANRTWSAVGWNPVYDGFNNCDMPDTWAGISVTVKHDGTWAVK